MKKDAIMQPYKPIVMVLALSTLVALPSLGIDWPKPILPPKVDAPTAVGGGSPSPGNTSSPAALSGADSRRLLLLPSVIANMQKGPLTPQRAWDEKLIDVDDLIWLLGYYIQPWGGFDGKIDVKLRRGLATLLVEHGGNRLKTPGHLPPSVRLWLADYFQSIGDERVIAITESALSEFREPVAEENTLIYQIIERLAKFYQDRGELEKAALTWNRVKQLHKKLTPHVGAALIEEARLYNAIGNARKASELYTLVSQGNDSWFAGVATFDYAKNLLSAGQHQTARQFLNDVLLKYKDPRVQLIALTFLGQSYYMTTELAEAQEYSKNALAQAQILKRLSEPGLDSVFAIAQDINTSATRWQKQPFMVQPNEIEVTLTSQQLENLKGKLYVRHIYVRSFRSIPLIVETDNPHIKANLQVDGWSEETGGKTEAEKEVIIEIDPQALRDTKQAFLIVQSKNLPNSRLRIPIQIKINP